MSYSLFFFIFLIRALSTWFELVVSQEAHFYIFCYIYIYCLKAKFMHMYKLYFRSLNMFS